MSEALDPLGARTGGRRPAWSVFRDELEAVGFRPSKTLGQNFLIDPNAARSLAEDAGLRAGDQVLEVGAGLGFLTVHLAELRLEILAVEIDPRLLAIARRLLAGLPGVRWLLADALEGKHELAPVLAAELPQTGPWHVVSNLPYSISAPLLVVLSRLRNPPRSLSVLVQDEVALRLAARPGGGDWGALSARLGLLYEIRPGRAVGAQLFWPRPRVASRVVHLAHHPVADFTPQDLPGYDALVDVLFQHRRKQLASVLTERLGQRDRVGGLIAEVGLDPRARPETLTPAQLLALSRGSAWAHRP